MAAGPECHEADSILAEPEFIMAYWTGLRCEKLLPLLQQIRLWYFVVVIKTYDHGLERGESKNRKCGNAVKSSPAIRGKNTVPAVEE